MCSMFGLKLADGCKEEPETLKDDWNRKYESMRYTRYEIQDLTHRLLVFTIHSTTIIIAYTVIFKLWITDDDE